MKTQRERRLTYGINVAIAAVVAVALVVLLNWLADRQLRKNLPPEARRWIRYDLTATRSYSLSPQTREVLGHLTDRYRIVTMLDTTGPNINAAKDLIAEYAVYSNKIEVEHISPLREISRRNAFLQTLTDRYKEGLAPMIAAIEQGQTALEQVRQDTQKQLEPIRKVLEDPALPDGSLKQFIRQVAQVFTRFDTQLEDAGAQVNQDLEGAMPAYASAKRTLQDLLGDLDAKVYAVAIDEFRKAATSQGTPPSVKDRLLELVDRLEQSRKNLQDTLATLRNAQSVSEYDQLRAQIISDPNTVTIVGPKQVQVLKLEDLFRRPTPDPSAEGQVTEPQFLGEERITGSLASMNLEHKPLVVLVTSGSSQPLGRGNPQMTYNEVAQRLRNMNFEVESWSPMPQQNPMTGQPMPPTPKPEPKEGQKAVWVILPGDPPNPMNPMAAAGPQQVADLVQERMDKGDGVMFVVMAQASMMGMPTADPMTPILDEWGITAQLDRVVLRQEITPDRRRMGIPQHEITQWPDASPITQALGAARAMFLHTSPIVFSADAKDDTKVWPLVEITGRELWAETNLMNLQSAQRTEAKAGDKFTVAVAAQKDGGRLVAVADPVWASDFVTTYGLLGEGTAAFTGALFPGNAELFVNSVYWLAGMDQLIAAGARTQDIRRIGELSQGAYSAIWWGLLLGMPAAAAVAGLGVWFIRRA